MLRKIISIHAPARGATAPCSVVLSMPGFQSTLPRGERPLKLMQTQYNISHFNPRSREGSDRSLCSPVSGSTQFQSTLPRGERLICITAIMCQFKISIHAPARGATCSSCPRALYLSHFNPRSREGSDPIKFFDARKTAIFQSTLPRGERPEPTPTNTTAQNFNPRSREGSDYIFFKLY